MSTNTDPDDGWMTVYRRADGQPIGDDLWVTDLAAFDDDGDPVTLTVEHWQRVAASPAVYYPPLYGCRMCGTDGDDNCFRCHGSGNDPDGPVGRLVDLDGYDGERPDA